MLRHTDLIDTTRSVNNTAYYQRFNFLSRPFENLPSEEQVTPPTTANGDQHSLSAPPVFNTHPAARPHYMMPTSSSSTASHTQQQYAQNHHQQNLPPPPHPPHPEPTKQRPLTPASLDNGISKTKKNWMASATKKFGIRGSVSKKVKAFDGARAKSASPVVGPYNSLNSQVISSPSQIPVLSQPRIRPRYHGPPEISPPDKPLPSLPVATIISKSPVHRRSLIDATERPLLRSLSPTPSGGGEELPALSPLRQKRDTKEIENGNAKPAAQITQVKPSVGESVIEGIQNLNIRDHSSFEEKEVVVGPVICKPPASHTQDHPRSAQDEAAVNLLDTTKSSSSAPEIRHTRTSAMRLSLANTNTSPSETVKPGPVQSKSRSRHGVTTRGSPYMRLNKSGSKLIHQSVRRRAPADSKLRNSIHLSSSPTSSEEILQRVDTASPVRPDHDARLESPSPSRGPLHKRKSSIPLPSRLIHREGSGTPDPKKRRFDESDHAVQVDPGEASEQHDDNASDYSEPEIIEKGQTVSKSSGIGPITSSITLIDTRKPAPANNLVSFGDLISQGTSPTEDANLSDAEDSVQCYSDDGGSRIKKIRGAHDATLTISPEADGLLSPSHQEFDKLKVEDRGSKLSSDGKLNHDGGSSSSRQGAASADHVGKPDDSSVVAQGHSDSELSLEVIKHSKSKASETLDGHSASDTSLQSVSHAAEEQHNVLGERKDSCVIDMLDPPDKLVSSNEAISTTPSSHGHGDWPFKEFENLGATKTANGDPSEKPASSWHAPNDWNVQQQQSARSSSDIPTYYGPQNTPTSRVSSPLHGNTYHEPHDATTNFAIHNATKENGLPEKIWFPPRTSSKQQVPTLRVNSGPKRLSSAKRLSSVHTPEKAARVVGLRPHTMTYSDQKALYVPKYARTFSESVKEAQKQYNTSVRNASSKRGQPHLHTGRKAMSTIRGLFNKRSGDMGGSVSQKGPRKSEDAEAKSSPLLATPTPMGRFVNGVSHGVTNGHRKPDPTGVENADGDGTSSASTGSALEPTEISLAHTSALKLLDLAAAEQSILRQNELIEISKLAIHVVNTARNAEKFLEEAKQAAAKAEIQALSSRKATVELTALVEKILDVD